MKKIIVIGGIFLILTLIVISGYSFFSQKEREVFIPQDPKINPDKDLPLIPRPLLSTTTETFFRLYFQANEVIIRVNNLGFELKDIEIKRGTKITWVSRSDKFL